MARCPSCDYPLPADRERLGARCPNCRDPLYEPRGRVSHLAGPGEGSCAVHESRLSVATCSRCGNFLCEVCRTPWRGKILCAACVDRTLDNGETTPEQARAHTRAAILSVVLGGAAWVSSGLFLVLVGLLASGSTMVGLALLLLLVLVGDGLLASLGLGHAIAALRTRGHHMILATAGMILSGLYLGVLIGLFTFQIWSS
jgi:hypothetical protein